jgi:hypothetical protein
MLEGYNPNQTPKSWVITFRHTYDRNQSVTGADVIRRPEYYYEKYVWKSIGVVQQAAYKTPT